MFTFKNPPPPPTSSITGGPSNWRTTNSCRTIEYRYIRAKCMYIFWKTRKLNIVNHRFVPRYQPLFEWSVIFNSDNCFLSLNSSTFFHFVQHFCFIKLFLILLCFRLVLVWYCLSQHYFNVVRKIVWRMVVFTTIFVIDHYVNKQTCGKCRQYEFVLYWHMSFL